MKVLIETDHESIQEGVKADSRGRVNLGKEFAGKRLSIAVVDEGDDDDE